ncbi:DUF3102 domain-containing protein [Bradyrhizobium oligotrophicum]|uniref:DUF3102 domain-containing protein n=1 Tax=Bradyrhizobium oligotrophicum TaxID=44255 RepID=UPI003EC143B7
MATTDEIALAEHAAVIRALGKRVIRDIIEIGRRLIDSKQRLGHGNFLPWIEREFGWSEQTARNFMQVQEVALKSPKFGDLAVPVSGLYLLAQPSTPDDARDEVITRAEAGERLSVADVQRIKPASLTIAERHKAVHFSHMSAMALRTAAQARNYSGDGGSLVVGQSCTRTFLIRRSAQSSGEAPRGLRSVVIVCRMSVAVRCSRCANRMRSSSGDAIAQFHSFLGDEIGEVGRFGTQPGGLRFR